MSKWKLYVTPVPSTTSEQVLRQIFEQYGKVQEVVLLKSKLSGLRQNSVFVIYETRASAEQAIQNLHEKVTLPESASPLLVRWAVQKEHEPSLSVNAGEAKLYVGMLSKSTTESEFRSIFEPFGEVSEVVILKDKITGQSKGNGFVRFARRDCATNAIAMLNNQHRDKDSPAPLQVRFAQQKQPGMPTVGFQSSVPFNPYAVPKIMSSWPQPPQVQSQLFNMLSLQPGLPVAGAPARDTRGPAGSNLFVLNIPDNYADADLASLFSNFGTIVSATVIRDKVTQRSKGYGFVSYDNPASATAAVGTLNGFTVGQKRLTVRIKGATASDTSAAAAAPRTAAAPY